MRLGCDSGVAEGARPALASAAARLALRISSYTSSAMDAHGAGARMPIRTWSLLSSRIVTTMSSPTRMLWPVRRVRTNIS